MANTTGAELQPVGGGSSPFDRIKRTDGHGDYWSARELMPLLGYRRWERFEDSIERARVSIATTGMDPDTEASRRREAYGRTRQVGTNYRLTRHGAFITAMNGDVRKPEIAAAQAYFAVKTRQAEMAEQSSHEKELPSHPEALRRWANEIEAREAAEKRAAIEAAGRKAAEEEIAVLEPKAAEADHHRAADGCMAIGDFANKLQAWARQNCGVRIYHEDVWDFLGDIGLIIRGNTIRKNQPTSFATERDYVRTKTTRYETKTRGDQVSTSSRLTSPGEGWAWDRAVTRLNDFGSLRKPMDGVA